MSRLYFCASLLVLAFAVTTAAAQEIPFKIEKGYLLISGKVNGDLPFEAAVSTGNLYSFYNESSLKKLRLFETSTNDIPGTALTGEKALSMVYVPQMTIADQKPVEVRMLPRRDALDAMSKAVGRKIDFILGADYFDGRVVQIDFKSLVFRFLDNAPFEYKSGTFQSADGGIRFVARMTGNIQSMFGNMLTLPVADDVSINGNKASSLLNTGVVMPVIAQANVAKLPTTKDSSAPQTIKVALGQYELTGVPVRVDNVRDDYDKSYTAILGLGLLQNFTITFDWKDKWIVMEK